jgi:nicotinamidase-related amidase
MRACAVGRDAAPLSTCPIGVLPMPSVLLIVDVQRALTEGEQACHDVAGVIDRVNGVAARARAAAVTVVVIQHEASSGGFVHGSRTWELAPALQVAPSDLLLRKTTPDAFERTSLKALLDERRVTDVVICGMQSEFCVDTTTRRAAALGYPVVLVADAHTTTDKPHLSASQIVAHHNQTLSAITSFGPRIRAVAAADLVFAN